MSNNAVGERALIAALGRRNRKARLARLGHIRVALPTLVLQLDMLDRYGVRVRVEVGQRLVLGHPAAEILQRDLAAEAGREVPDLVRPLLELEVMGHAALQRDRIVLCAARRFAAAAGVAPLAVLHYFGRTL